jgi:hypothetical protein
MSKRVNYINSTLFYTLQNILSLNPCLHVGSTSGTTFSYIDCREDMKASRVFFVCTYRINEPITSTVIFKTLILFTFGHSFIIS